MLTTRPYIRTVTQIQPEWYAFYVFIHFLSDTKCPLPIYRLLELAPLYYDLREFKDAEYTRALKKVQAKKLGKAYPGVEGKRSKSSTPVDDGRQLKKAKRG